MQDPSPIATKKTRFFRCTVALGLFLSLATPILWPSSAIAQQFPQRPRPVNINLAFGDIHLASLRSDKLPFNTETKHGQTDPQGRFLTSDKRKLCQQPFAAPDGIGQANAALLRNPGPTRPMQIEGSLTPLAARRSDLAHLPPAESVRSQRFPALYQEDTPFSSQVRMPVADLWRGRLQFDGYYREISADSVFRGLLQSRGVWATPGTLAPRSATSYGIRLSFRLPHIHTRTVCRYFVGGRR